MGTLKEKPGGEAPPLPTSPSLPKQQGPGLDRKAVAGLQGCYKLPAAAGTVGAGPPSRGGGWGRRPRPP